MTAAAAHHHVDAIDINAADARFQIAFEIHQLRGDILTTRSDGSGRHIADVFPVAVSRFGIGGCRGRVSDAGSRQNAGRFAGDFCQLQRGHQFVAGNGAAVAALSGFADANDAGIGFNTAHHRRHGAGGVRRLRISVVGFCQT